MRKAWQTYALPAALVVHTLAAAYLFRLSLWTDEASSVWFARMSLRDLLLKLCDPHPPGYYMLLHLWLRVGSSEIWLRIPSLLASLCALLLVYRWMAAWQGQKSARWALVLLALQPMQVWYAAEVRMYTLAQCLMLLSAYLAWKLWQDEGGFRPKISLAIAYWLSASAAIWTDYTAVFGLAMTQLLWLACARPLGLRWIGLQLLLTLPTTAWWLSTGQLNALGDSYQPILVATRVQELGIPLSITQASSLLQLGLALGAVFALLLALYWQRLYSTIDFRVLVSGLLIGWSIGLLLASFPALFTLKRVSMTLLPWAAMLVGWGIAQLPTNSLRAAPLLLLPLLAQGLTHQKTNWRLASSTLLPQIASEIPVWVDELAFTALDYYAPNQAFWQPMPDTVEEGGPMQIMVVGDDNYYRPLDAALPAAVATTYSPVSISTPVFGVQLVELVRQSTLTIEPDSQPLVVDFPSPLAVCR